MRDMGEREDAVEPGTAPFLLECLEAIYRLEQARAPASLVPLAKRLGLGRAATAERILALQGRGLVQAEISGRILLTAESASRAA